jgi:CheY-like chemotaxis protein
MQESANCPLRGRNILVVEDDPLVAIDLQGTLEVAGATVIGPAYDLPHALGLIETSKVCAAVLDYRLQVGNTLPLARVLAERGIPFLFQTSDPVSVAREQPEAVIISKPYRHNEIVLAVQALLAGH